VARSKYLLEHMSWPKAAAALKTTQTVLVPVGAIEQHGPHLPLATDAIAPAELASKVAEKIGAVVAPVIRPGISQHHMAFPGTITLSAQTFIGLVKDYCHSLAKHGFRRIILLNGHGGNSHCLGVAVAELHQELPETEISTFEWWAFVPREMGSVMGMKEGIHANRMETACMLALAPELVDMDAAVAELPDYPEGMTPDKLPVFMSTVKTITDLSRSGVVGDPTKATRELGEELLQKVVGDMVEAFAQMEDISRRRAAAPD